MNLPKQDNYEIALSMAEDELKRRDPADAAAKAAISPPHQNSLQLKFIDRNLIIDVESGKITAEDGEEVNIATKILALHYVNRADGAQPADRWVTFAELENGRVYQDVFRGRDEGRMAGMCAKDPDAWLAAVEKLGGEHGELGDLSVNIQAFPQIPVFMVYWAGEEEIPPAGKILFDANINNYLCTEDVAVMCDLILDRIKKELAG